VPSSFELSSPRRTATWEKSAVFCRYSCGFQMARRVTNQEGEVMEDLQRDIFQCCVVEQLITIW